ncbi:MAG TPA: TrkA family potassium uptake protein [Planctomycetaceae bacterium]|nr:TrkA family potassium uptake protein [Planctomycetaceae bacterium]
MAQVKQHFIVLGLGTFGGTLARKLSENGCRVTGVDLKKELVEELKDVLYEAVIADATERASLEQLSISKADAVFISLGGTIIPSLLAALHAKELKARRMIVKGLNQEHARLLEHLGVERVIFPEIEVASELARRMTQPNVLDFLPIDPDYSLVEIAVPDSWSGHTLSDVALRSKFDVWVVGVKDVLSGKLKLIPDGRFRLTDSQMLLVIGRKKDIDRLCDVE